jgi:dihydropteroate synthase
MTPTLRKHYTLALPGGRSLELGARTLVMGILNVTPDSFSDGGRHESVSAALEAAAAMVEAGADLIDVGGESTRPGAAPVDEATERARVVPVVAALAAQLAIPISVDTSKALVARAAIHAGATMINDISGLRRDAGLGAVAASTGAALVVMHMRGATTDMYREASYVDVAKEVAAELAWSVEAAERAGVSRGALVIDPGIGFAKRATHSWQVLARLGDPTLLALDLPMLVGASRKSFLQAAVGERPAQERDAASIAAATVAVLSGAHIVRVHDVPGSVQAVRVADMISAAVESGSI